ncbi:MAG: hypothetical protein M3O71_23030 [Bacteroidota bacterium]|nr:hypothetical protein [Bacteroidota bacterium]
MNNSESYSEKLIQYMDGELTENELAAFEKLLSENSLLQEELKNLELAKMAIRSYGLKSQVASVRQQMIQDLKEDRKPAESKIYPFIRSTLKYAASILLVLSAIGIYMYSTTTSKKLYQEGYQPYKISITRGENTNSNLEAAFNGGNFNEVINIFKNTPNPGSKETFLAAQSYLSLHQLDNAIQSFNQVLQPSGSDNNFRDYASYYLALAYIEDNKPVKALPIFEKIHADADNLYHDKVSYWTLLKLRILTFKNTGK